MQSRTRGGSDDMQYAPVLYGLGNMRACDRGAAGQVGDAARHAQYAVVGAGRPVQAQHGAVQQLLARGVELAMQRDLLVLQSMVGFALARQLQGKRRRHARGDRRRAFAGKRLRAQHCRRHGRHFDLQIDAVEQRT